MVSGRSSSAAVRMLESALFIPSRKKASAFSLLPWRCGVATSSSSLGVVSLRKSSGQTSSSERRSQT